jgi:hypothetical protein
MEMDRWDHVDKLLQSALDRPTEDRDAFLRRACGTDEQLEQAVRSLLAAHDRAGSFLGTPAVAPAADSLIGQTLSHYRIVEKLGGGGPSFARRSEARASYGGSSVAKERICS